jgi:transposase-like protein
MSNKRTFIRYSEAFKQQVIQEIESGRLTLSQARLKYGIAGTATIQGWARKFGSYKILPKVIHVKKPNEVDQLKALKEENQRLKLALAEAMLDKTMTESQFEAVCEAHGIDPEAAKKKVGTQLRLKALGKEKK